jgi:hypothetical protein
MCPCLPASLDLTGVTRQISEVHVALLPAEKRVLELLNAIITQVRPVHKQMTELLLDCGRLRAREWERHVEVGCAPILPCAPPPPVTPEPPWA